MVGATGAVVSTVTAIAAEAAPVLPATSVAVAVRLCAPLASVPVVYVQAPLPLAVVVPSNVVPSKTFTVALASAVPVSVNVASLVIPSPTTPLSVENDAMIGAAGAGVSMVTL